MRKISFTNSMLVCLCLLVSTTLLQALPGNPGSINPGLKSGHLATSTTPTDCYPPNTFYIENEIKVCLGLAKESDFNLEANGCFSYSDEDIDQPNIQWYTSLTGGEPIFTGIFFNPVGVPGSGIADLSPEPGLYNFYAACSDCPQLRTKVTINVVEGAVAPTFEVVQPTCLNPNGTITLFHDSDDDESSTFFSLYSYYGNSEQVITEVSGVFSNVEPDTYFGVFDSDFNIQGCPSLPVEVTIDPAPQAPTPETPTLEVTPISCSMPTGTITVTNSAEGFTYILQPGGISNSTGIFEDLTAGEYTVEVSSICDSGSSTFSTITVEPVYGSILNIEATNISPADCQNTTCTDDDSFTADVTVTYQNIPISGTLTLTGTDVVGNYEVNVSDINGTSHTFISVVMKADGGAIALSAGFSEGCDKEVTAAQTAPYCSSNTCDITAISINNESDCINPENTTTADDDYFTADVSVTFEYAPENQTLVLTDANGDVLATKEVNPGLLCTTTCTFFGVKLPANGQAVSLKASFEDVAPNKPATDGSIAFAIPAGCFFTNNNIMTAPASCSCTPTEEVCNGIDDDCDGVADNDISITYYLDFDGDGFGDAANSIQSGCTPPTGYVLIGSDCNDTNPAINPAAFDICNNNIDEDCSGTAAPLPTTCVKPTLTAIAHVEPCTNKVTFKWEQSCYKRFRLQYRSITPVQPWFLILLPQNTATYEVTGLPADRTYQWGLRGECFSNNQWSLITAGSNFSTASCNGLVAQNQSGFAQLTGAVSAYPNPSNHVLQVTWPATENTTAFVRLVDQLGRTLTSQTTEAHATEFDVTAYPSGIYFVQVLRPNAAVEVIRVMIER